MRNRDRTAAAVVGALGVAMVVGTLPPVAAGGSVFESAESASTGPVVASATRGSRIAFTRSVCYHFGHSSCRPPTRLYVTDADGTDQRRLGVGSDPVWSPDGRRIAYVGDNRLGSGIQVVKADGTGATRLAAGSSPAWSPDGNWIMYEVWPSEMYVIRPDGTDKRRLAVGNSPVWSPDGRRIAFRRTTETADGRQINSTMVMNADGSEVKQLDVAPAADGSAPVWSPDGRWIAWDEVSWGQMRFGVFAIHPDGTGKRRLATGSNPVWSPDGRRIAFTSYNRGGRAYLAVMNADGSHVTRAKRTPAAPLWSPNGRWIAFYRPVGGPAPPRRYEVWVARADGTHVEKLSRGVPWAWSPNGRRIVFTRYTGDRGILKVMDTKGRHMRELTPSRKYVYDQGAAWSVPRRRG